MYEMSRMQTSSNIYAYKTSNSRGKNNIEKPIVESERVEKKFIIDIAENLQKHLTFPQ